jgi:hypothetical protein
MEEGVDSVTAIERLPNYAPFRTLMQHRFYSGSRQSACITGRIADTRAAVVARLEKLKNMPRFQNQEREAIDDALRGLQVLEREEAASHTEDEQRIIERALANLRPLAPAS